MKAEIHPDYHNITVVMTDGTKYQTRSCYGKEGDTINLDVDPLNHPAWLGGTGKVVEKGQLSKFEKRFGGFGQISGTAEQQADAKAAKAAAAVAKKDKK
jgi:large subunit ribosomal protein L31